MRKKTFGRLAVLLMKSFPRYAILRCKNRVTAYFACDESQDARTRLMEAYVCIPKRKNDAIRMHNEACMRHIETRYSSPENEAEIALRIASFRRHHLNDLKGAEYYETSAFDLTRRHGITSLIARISREFPQLLIN